MRRTIETEALFLGAVPYGETAVVATWLTEREGKLSTMVRGARSSRRRVNGALDYVHGVYLRAEDTGAELLTLKEAVVRHVRLGVTGDLDALAAAGTALRWVRHACPPRTPEPDVFQELSVLLDDLERQPSSAKGQGLLTFGLRLLRHVGYELVFDRCASCGRPRPPARRAHVDAGRGGVICRACHGGGEVLADDLLLRLARISSGEVAQLSRKEGDLVMRLVTRAMTSHTELAPPR